MSVVTVSHVEKFYGNQGNITQALNDISFAVEKQEFTAVMGASGSGKTTLLNVISTIDAVSAGNIEINGNSICELRENELAEFRKKELGFIFQDFNLFPQYNVLQNLTLAPSLLKMGTKEELEAQARQIIKKVGLEEKVDFYPCQLSGGQKQRVAIARALMLNPDILCFDEPTSALDPELTGEVLRVIKSLKDTGSTMIVVTHEMEFARNVSDKVMFMADGVVEEMGDPAQIFDNPQSEKTRAFLANSLEKL